MRTDLSHFGLRSAFTDHESSSDVLVVTRRHARAGLLPSDALIRDALLSSNEPEFDLRAKGLRFISSGKGNMGESPRTPSVFENPPSRNPFGQIHAKHGNVCVSPRTVSPFLHSCPASGGASSFLPASALPFHHEALRPPNGQDARCVSTTSAIRTNCVYPRFRTLPACSPRLSPCGRRAGSGPLRDLTGESGVFTTPDSLRSIANHTRFWPPRSFEVLPRASAVVSVFFSRCEVDNRTSGIPVASLSSTLLLVKETVREPPRPP